MINIYVKYSGDIDSWVRNNSKKELALMSDNDWFLIDGFIQDLTLVKTGLVSLDFGNYLNDRLKKYCDSEKTINKIKKL